MTAPAIRALRKLAPLSLAESWDNVGLLVQPPALAAAIPKPRVLITNDLTLADVENAHPDTGLIVSYHPPIFRPLARLHTDDPLTRVLMLCIQRGIAVYSPHTALDAAAGGISDWFAATLVDRLKPHLSGKYAPVVVPIYPKEAPPPGHENASGSKLINFPEQVPITKFVAIIKEVFDLKTVMLSQPENVASISSVAFCPGSGGSVLSKVSADCYITGEMGHHEVLAARKQGITVVLCNHSNTERPFFKYWAEELEKQLSAEGQTDAIVDVSEHDKDPLQFV